MANARIYKPAKSTMQSGRGRTSRWILEFERQQAKFTEPLMGWTGSKETQSQVILEFPTCEAAISHAESLGLFYNVVNPKTAVQKPKSYADNFRFGKVEG